MNFAVLTALTLIGTWRYAGFRYDGADYPNPNPDLILTFSFEQNGTSRLEWHRLNEPGFCERRGLYHLDGNILWQKTTWINPHNAPECAKDSDMQPDRETTTALRLSQSELFFVFDLDGREFLYRLKREQSVSSLPR